MNVPSRFLLPCLLALLTLAAPTVTRAATLKVAQDGSGQYTKIQDAVNAAANGDTVLVGDGTYSGDGNRDIDFHGKSLTVTSQNGPAKTIIDCGGYASTGSGGTPDGLGNHRGFYIHSGEINATISGLTVKNGYEAYVYNTFYNGNGGGVYNSGSGTITLTDCAVTGNTASIGGGGVYNSNNGGTVTLTNCTVAGNTASNGDGGGVYNGNYNGGTVTLTNCAVTGNTASSGGGVCNVNDGTITLIDCTVAGNTASYYGGGVYNNTGGEYSNTVNGSRITLTNCTITGNTAPYGGGVYNDKANGNNGSIMLTNCTVAGNTASNGGGVYNGNLLFLYYGNNGSITLTNCTVAGNTASNGGGVYNDTGRVNGSTITLANDVIYSDIGGEVYNDIGNGTAATSIISFSFSDIQGGYSGAGNIDKDPLFVNAASGDLHLKPGSPCLGAGTPNGAPATDADGNSRPNPPSMGAYELGVLPAAIINFTLSPNQVDAPGPLVLADVAVTGTFKSVSITCAPGSLKVPSPTFALTESSGHWTASIPTAFLKLAKVNPITFIATGTRADGLTATMAGTLNIGAAPMLTLSLSSNKTSVGPGSEVTFSGVVNNLSSIDAKKTTLNIPLPVYDLEFVPGSAQGIGYDANSNNFYFSGSLSVAGGKTVSSQSYSFKVRVKSTVFNGTKISLTATASCSGFRDATVSRSLDVDQLTKPAGLEIIGDTFSGLLDGKVDVHSEAGYPPLDATVSPIPMRPDIFLGQRRFDSWLSVIKIDTDSNVTCNPSSGVGGRLAAKGLVSPSVSPTFDATFLNVNDSLTLHVGIDNTSALANLVEDLYTVFFPFTPDDVVATLNSWKSVSAFTDVSNYMTNPPPKNSVELSKAVAKSVLRLTVGLKSADVYAIQHILEAKFGKSVSKAQVLLIASKAFSAIKIAHQFGDVLYLNLHGGVTPFEPDLTVKFIATTNSNP